MATSGTKTWTLYVDEVIDESLSRIGSDPITGKEASSARRTLNTDAPDDLVTPSKFFIHRALIGITTAAGETLD